MNILYLTSNDNMGIFDFLENRHYLHHIVGKFKIGTTLPEIFQHEYGVYDVIAMDLKSIIDKPETIAEVLKQFSYMQERIVIYAEGMSRSNQVIDDLIENGYYNIITGATLEVVREQIEDCFSVEGMTYTMLTQHLNSNGMNTIDEEESQEQQYTISQKGDNLFINICGAESKVGATSLSLNFAYFLTTIGAKVACIVSEEIKERIHSFLDEQGIPFLNRGDFWEGMNIHFYTNQDALVENYDFIVLDNGVIGASINAKFYEINLLVCGTTPWEIQRWEDLRETVVGKGEYTLIFNRNPEQKNQILNAITKEFYHNILWLHSIDSFFHQQQNFLVYKEAMGLSITENYSLGNSEDLGFTAIPKDEKKRKKINREKKFIVF